jgi:hypothetical protein
METVNDFQTAIDNELVAQTATTPELSNITTSSFAEWIGIRDIFANVAFTLVAGLAAFKTEVLGIVSTGKYGTATWWKQTMLNYQDGDPLPVGETTYANIDLTKRIITRCSITKNSVGTLIVKVAKTTGALSTTIGDSEYIRVNDYITEIKPFCVDHLLISFAADQMRCVINIRFDGKLSQASVQTLVDAAINNFLATGIEFNGKFNINRFRAAIAIVPGVVDVDISTIEIRPNGGSAIDPMAFLASAKR